MMLFPVLNYERIGSRDVRLEAGVLDVSRLNFNEGLYQLSGEIETYAEWFLEPGKDAPFAPAFQALPFAWPAVSGVRYGSYRFFLSGLTPGKTYGFFLLEPLTACEVLVDGVSIARLGTPSNQPDETVGAIRVQSATFRAEHEQSEVIIRVSSRSSHPVGIWQKTLFGPGNMIHAHELDAKLADSIVIGALLAVTVFIWIMFLVVRKDKAIVAFTLSSCPGSMMSSTASSC